MFFTTSDTTVYNGTKGSVSLAYGHPSEYALDALVIQAFPDLDVMLQTSMMKTLDQPTVDSLINATRAYSASLPSIEILVAGRMLPVVVDALSVGFIPYEGLLAKRLMYAVPLDMSPEQLPRSSLQAKTEVMHRVLKLADGHDTQRIGLPLFDTMYDANGIQPDHLYGFVVATVLEYLHTQDIRPIEIVIFPGAISDTLILPGAVNNYPHQD